MLIVDAQVHIWANSTPERPWPKDGFGREHSAEALSADALVVRMDEAGIDRAVIVPPSWRVSATIWRLTRRGAIPTASR